MIKILCYIIPVCITAGFTIYMVSHSFFKFKFNNNNAVVQINTENLKNLTSKLDTVQVEHIANIEELKKESGKFKIRIIKDVTEIKTELKHIFRNQENAIQQIKELKDQMNGSLETYINTLKKVEKCIDHSEIMIQQLKSQNKR